MLQAVPFQCSISVAVGKEQLAPTAQTSFEEISATASSEFPPHWKLPSSQFGTGFGVGTALQLVPFQWRARVSLLVVVACRPTAQASVALLADTAWTMLP
jgi:hypothetical protein